MTKVSKYSILSKTRKLRLRLRLRTLNLSFNLNLNLNLNLSLYLISAYFFKYSNMFRPKVIS